MIISEFATTVWMGLALFHAARNLTDNDGNESEDYKAAAKTFVELAGERLIDGVKDVTGISLGSADEELGSGIPHRSLTARFPRDIIPEVLDCMQMKRLAFCMGVCPRRNSTSRLG